MNRRHLLLAAGAGISSFALPAWAATPAEDFVANNIHTGFVLLNDHSLDATQRRDRFAAFVLGLTDTKRVALFLLGRYADTASPADIDLYVAAYQDYILAVYQSYFAMYAGQSLRVLDSRERAAQDFVVRTTIVGNAPQMEIDFRVRTDGPKPVLVDMSVAGIWLALAQRDQFLAVLAQNNGDIKALVSHLRDTQKLYR
ncbi:MAG TPA: ABC transporter substrate-binding protein [Rhizomicrobium sp.]